MSTSQSDFISQALPCASSTDCYQSSGDETAVHGPCEEYIFVLDMQYPSPLAPQLSTNKCGKKTYFI